MASFATPTEIAPGQQAAERIFRTLAVAVGVGGSVFNALAIPETLTQVPYLQPWFTAALIVTLWGVPLAFIAVAPWVSHHVNRAIASCCAIAFLLAMVLWMPMMTVPALPGGASSWLLTTLTVYCAMGALAWRPPLAWLYTVVVAIGTGLLSFASRGTADFSLAFQDGLYSLFISSIFVAMILVTRRIGEQLDATAIAAIEESKRSARTRAFERETARFNALVHDDVIATLLAAGRGDDLRRDGLLREQAIATLTKLDALSSGNVRASAFDVDEFIAETRSTVTELSTDIEVEVRVSGEHSIPAAVASALTEAVGEAVRNSVNHAIAPDAASDSAAALRRRVTIEISPSRVQVVVSDDGQGFVPSRVAPQRLGIAVSIRARMASLPGGYSRISTSKSGTSVTVGWNRQ